MLRSLLCDEHNHFLVVENTGAISDLVRHKNRYLWLDVERPTAEEFKLLEEEFKLHPLAVEDATIRHQRPKIEQYPNFYFVVFYAVGSARSDDTERVSGRAGLRGVRFHESDGKDMDKSDRSAALPGDGSTEGDWVPGNVVLREMSMFLGENYLITVHEDPIPEFDEVAQRWYRNIETMRNVTSVGRHPEGTRQLTPTEAAALRPTPAEVARPEDGPVLWQPSSEHEIESNKSKINLETLIVPRSPGQLEEVTDGDLSQQSTSSGILLYSMLDTIVDSYFPLIDGIVDRIEDLEEQIFEQFNQAALQSVFLLKKDLLALRKVLAPERDVLNILTRRDLPIFEERTLVYFQDVYDHIVRITDSIDTYRDLLSSALDSFLSMQSNRLNVTVQTLTSVSIMLMSMAAITGWYGMNFAVMPELGSWWGYPGVIIAVASIITIEFIFFKRKGWL